MNVPVWIISLDLSKAFDRVAWPELWKALREHGVSEHMIWTLQSLYADQVGQIRQGNDASRKFDILAGVRQGCVLSARLFCSVLQWAMRDWRQQMEAAGIDLKDGLKNLLDVRFADDILLFCRSQREAGHVLDNLVHHLARVGLILNAAKTVALTTEAQPPETLVTPAGTVIKVIERTSAQKWLGCMLSAHMSGDHGLDVDYHLQAASRAFYANRWILTDKAASLRERLRYFEAVVTPVAGFAAGHRTIYQDDLHKLDVQFRKFMRQVISPPADVDWSGPFHEVLHSWHEKISNVRSAEGILSWAEKALQHYWQFASYVAQLPEDRWLCRVLKWMPDGCRAPGRPCNAWDGHLKTFCALNDLGDWWIAAKDARAWTNMTADFLEYATSS